MDTISISVRECIKNFLGQRSMIFLSILTGVVFILSLSVVLLQQTYRQKFIHLQALKHKTEHYETEWTQLLLEEATWSSASRIQQFATENLNMFSPDIPQLRVLALPAQYEPNPDGQP